MNKTRRKINLIQRITVCCLVVFILIMCSACGKEKIETINVDIIENIKNLDPQFATSEIEQNVIINIYEGLMRYSYDGEVVLGVADECILSDDKTEYTFKIKHNAKWNNGDDLTSYDFLFTFKRLFAKEHKSPYVHNLLSIKNAQEVLDGTLPFEEMGVLCPDKKTFVVKINEPKDDFLKVFAQSYTFPCNEKFFKNTHGKYGVEKEYILSNGALNLSKWNKNSIVSLTRNKYYYDENNKNKSDVNIHINRKAKKEKTSNNMINLMLENKTDIFTVSEKDREYVPTDLYTLNKISNKTWYIGLNAKSRYFGNNDLAKAFAFDNNNYGEYNEKLYEKTKSILPPSVLEGYNSINYITPTHEELISAYKQGISNFEENTLTNVKFYYDKECEFTSVLKEYAKQKNQMFGTLISPKAVETEEYNKILSTGSFDIILFSLSAKSSEPLSFFKQFVSGDVNNICSISNSEYDELIKIADSINTQKERYEQLNKAEKILLDTYNIQPIFNTSEYFTVNSSIKNFGHIGNIYFFRDAVKMK